MKEEVEDRKRFSKRVRELEGAGVEEGLKDKNFNAQTWLDVRMFADVCRVYVNSGVVPRTSIVLRECVERVHEVAVEMLSEEERFYDADSAVEFLRSVGISVSQFTGDRRAKSAMSKTLVLQDRVMEFGGPEAMKRKVKAGSPTVEDMIDVVKQLEREGRIPGPSGGSGIVDSNIDPTIRAQRAAEEVAEQKARMDEFVKSLKVAKGDGHEENT